MIVREDERLDFNRIPESRGIPKDLYRALILGLLIIFSIGGSVVLFSGYGHMWPSNTTLRVPLSSNGNQ
jgi:hypothetical protein